MLDCERLDWDIDEIVGGLDEGKYDYQQLMFDLCVVEPDEINDNLPPVWNHLEHYEPGETKLLHYTVVPTQPWKNDKNPLQDDLGARVPGGTRGRSRAPQTRRYGSPAAGHIKPSLALPPDKKVATALSLGAAKARRVIQLAEQQFGFLRHPRIMKLRARLGL